MREKTVLLTNGFGETGYPTCKGIKLYPYLTLYTKINSKWVKQVNLRPKSINHLEENTRGKVS